VKILSCLLLTVVNSLVPRISPPLGGEGDSGNKATTGNESWGDEAGNEAKQGLGMRLSKDWE